MATEWTNEQVCAQWRKEVVARFQKDNDEYRELVAQEHREWVERDGVDCVEKFLAEHPNYPYDPGTCTSGLWKMWEAANVTTKHNTVKIVTYGGPNVIEFLTSIGHTSVCWSKPHVELVIIEGVPAINITIYLIDYWDDERAEKWLLDHNN